MAVCLKLKDIMNMWKERTRDKEKISFLFRVSKLKRMMINCCELYDLFLSYSRILLLPFFCSCRRPCCDTKVKEEISEISDPSNYWNAVNRPGTDQKLLYEISFFHPCHFSVLLLLFYFICLKRLSSVAFISISFWLFIV